MAENIRVAALIDGYFTPMSGVMGPYLELVGAHLVRDQMDGWNTSLLLRWPIFRDSC